MLNKLNISGVISELIHKVGFKIAADKLYKDHKDYIKKELLEDYPWLDNKADDIIKKVLFYLCKHMLG